MFINTSTRTVIDHTRYPGQLAVCVKTEDRNVLGVFAGRHCSIPKEEQGFRLETVRDETWSGEGLEVFVVPLAERGRMDGLTDTRYYAVVSWETSAVHLEYPVGRDLTVTTTDRGRWLSFAGVTVMLEGPSPDTAKA